jgi:antitoxin MazE
MAKTKLAIERRGKCLATSIPDIPGRSVHSEVGQEIDDTADEVGLSLKPTLAEKLARFDPKKHGGEVMTTL